MLREALRIGDHRLILVTPDADNIVEKIFLSIVQTRLEKY
jgi:hypothetical protein